jgi:hypothetical protein
MVEMRNVDKSFVGNPVGKTPLRRARYIWEIILKYIFATCGWRLWITFTWLRIGIGGGLF